MIEKLYTLEEFEQGTYKGCCTVPTLKAVVCFQNRFSGKPGADRAVLTATRTAWRDAAVPRFVQQLKR